jgi:glucokinase
MLYVAIDTGITKVASAVVNEEGEILRKDQYPRANALDKDSTMQLYGEIIKKYNREYPIKSVGIGVGGRIDVKTGKFNFGTSASPGWEDVNVIQELQALSSLPIAIENDCKVAIIGENWKGSTQLNDTVLGVIIGTGLGGGYMYQGEMIYGSRYGAGEVGHTILYPGGKKCLCGQSGCSEMYCSGTAIWQSYNEQKLNAPITSGYEFFDLYRAKDQIAIKCLDKFSYDLAILLVSLGNLFDPQVILIGGGIIDTREYWWDNMLMYYKELSSTFVGELHIVASRLRNDAALLGAAKIALDLVKT